MSSVYRLHHSPSIEYTGTDIVQMPQRVASTWITTFPTQASLPSSYTPTLNSPMSLFKGTPENSTTRFSAPGLAVAARSTFKNRGIFTPGSARRASRGAVDVTGRESEMRDRKSSPVRTSMRGVGTGPATDDVLRTSSPWVVCTLEDSATEKDGEGESEARGAKV